MARSSSTLADVARQAGVDTSTVSRVLNGDTRQRVSAETRERIVSAARQLNYRANAQARGLRTARSHTLGIVVPLLDSPVFSQIIDGARQAAAAAGYALLIVHIADGTPEEQAYERLAQVNNVDGLLVGTQDEDSAAIRAVRRAGIPFILLNRNAGPGTHCIYFELAKAAKLAVDHLVALGHRRIALLAGDPVRSSGTRVQGYRLALDEAGLPFDEALVAVSGYTVAGGSAAMSELLSRPGPAPTSVFALTLAAAAGAMAQLRERGFSVPHDVSVATIHDGAIAQIVSPQLTTVRLPVYEMGEQGAIGLIDVIEGRRTAVNALLAHAELLVRGSTAAPRQPRRSGAAAHRRKA